MQKKPITILGINPGGKYLGIAVFRGPELRDWRVKVTKGKWSTEKYLKTMEILSRFVEQHSPDALSVKRLNPSRSSIGLDRLVQEIIALSEKKGIRVCQYGIKELEAFFYSEGKSNKRKMAEIITSEYPVLHCELNFERRNKNPYHLRMFEAVALGSICFHQLDNNNNCAEEREFWPSTQEPERWEPPFRKAKNSFITGGRRSRGESNRMRPLRWVEK